jgi:hypothetical protein
VLLTTSQFNFCIPRVEVCYEQFLDFIFQSNEGERAVIFIVVRIMLEFNEKKSILNLVLCLLTF